MDLTYRFRFLFYIAAFMLVMSVCFVYAEPADQSHLLLKGAPMHPGFLAESGEPSFDPAALRTAVTPNVSPQTLQQVLTHARPRRSLVRHAPRQPLQFAPVQQQNESKAVPASIRGSGSPIHP